MTKTTEEKVYIGIPNLTKKEKEKIQKKADKARLGLAAFCRIVLLECDVDVAVTTGGGKGGKQ